MTVNDKCKPPVINTPFIPDITFFIEDPVNSFTFAEFTHTGDSGAFVMFLTSSLVDLYNPLLHEDLPSGFTFDPLARKYEFRYQDASSYKLRIVCHLKKNGDDKEIAEKEIQFQVNFVRREVITADGDTIDS